MPVNPVTNEEQGALFQEFDIKVNRSIVGGTALRVSDDWVTNGVWALKRQRVSNQTIFTCACCLQRDTGLTYITPAEDYAIEAMFNMDSVMERWARTEHQIEVVGTDFTRYISDAGQVCYIRRDYQEHLGLQYVYGDDPQAGLWDNPSLHDASVVVAAHRDPQHVRLQLRDLMNASEVEEVAYEDRVMREADLPTVDEPEPSFHSIPDDEVDTPAQSVVDAINEIAGSDIDYDTLRGALSSLGARIGEYTRLTSRAMTLLMGSRLNVMVELPDGCGVTVLPRDNAEEEAREAFLPVRHHGVGTPLDGSRVVRVQVQFGIEDPGAVGSPVVITETLLSLEDGRSWWINHTSAEIGLARLVTEDYDAPQDELLMPEPTAAQASTSAAFPVPAFDPDVEPVLVSEDLFNRLRASAEGVNMDDATTWRVNRVSNIRIVPLVANDGEGVVIALRTTTENSARNLGGAIRPVQSGNSVLWVSENSPRMYVSINDDDESRRDWMIEIEGREEPLKVVFMPDWTATTHYVAVFLTESQSVVRYVEQSRLTERTNSAVRALLKEVVQEVLADTER